MDRRWPNDAEAAAGRPRPRAATLGYAAVRAQELLRVNHSRHPHACARRRFHTARFFNFLVQQRGPSRLRRGWRRLAEPTVPPALPRRPSYAVAAEGRPRLRAAVMWPRQPFSLPTRAREGRRAELEIAVSFFSFSSADRAGGAEVGGAGRRWCRRRSSIRARCRGGRATRWLPKAARASQPPPKVASRGFEGRFDYAAFGTVANVRSHLSDLHGAGRRLIMQGRETGATAGPAPRGGDRAAAPVAWRCWRRCGGSRRQQIASGARSSLNIGFALSRLHFPGVRP